MFLNGRLHKWPGRQLFNFIIIILSLPTQQQGLDIALDVVQLKKFHGACRGLGNYKYPLLAVAYLLNHLSLFPESPEYDFLRLLLTSSSEEISLSTKKTEKRLQQLDR